MPIDIRLPNITATDPTAKVAQLQSYMYQMVEQLNWALSTIESGSGSSAVVVQAKGSGELSPVEAENTFNSIKDLIIKSADIIEAYSEEISRSLSSKYLAISDYGTYEKELNSKISANAANITQNYSNIQSITNVDGTGTLDMLLETRAYIKTGLLYTDSSGYDVYGVEVGQTNDNGFNKFARFVSNRLSFYDNNGNEVAYISDYMLYITNATILGNLQLGKFVIDTSNGISFRWVGGE